MKQACNAATAVIQRSIQVLEAGLSAQAEAFSIPPPPPPPPPPPEITPEDYSLKAAHWLEQDLAPWIAEHLGPLC